MVQSVDIRTRLQSGRSTNRGLVSGRAWECFFVTLSVNRPGCEVDHTPSTAEVNAWSYIATRHTSLSAVLNYGLVQIYFNLHDH